MQKRTSPHERESGFQNWWNFCLWNLEPWALETGIQLKESGILLTIGIQNPSCTDKDRNPVPVMWKQRREIQNPRRAWIPLHGARIWGYNLILTGNNLCTTGCSVKQNVLYYSALMSYLGECQQCISKTGIQAYICYFSDKSLWFFVAGKVPCLKNREQNIVAISKHLCGAATGKTSIRGSLWGWPPIKQFFWLSHNTPFHKALCVELKIPCELKETTCRAFPLWCTEIIT